MGVARTFYPSPVFCYVLYANVHPTRLLCAFARKFTPYRLIFPHNFPLWLLPHHLAILTWCVSFSLVFFFFFLALILWQVKLNAPCLLCHGWCLSVCLFVWHVSYCIFRWFFWVFILPFSKAIADSCEFPCHKEQSSLCKHSIAGRKQSWHAYLSFC